MASNTDDGFDLEEDIVDFEGKGIYSDPELVWMHIQKALLQPSFLIPIN
jgi:hypothetical protein